MPGDNKIIFNPPLIEGVAVKRKSQFAMIVNIDGIDMNCHCPTTGRIGNIEISGRPCLLSKSSDPERKTPFTVEAVSLDKPEDGDKTWIGINQNAVNRYVEHYLKNGGFKDFVEDGSSALREQFLGTSKLDFLVGDTYLEVKMPLQTIQMDVPAHVVTKRSAPFNSTDRFVRHITELRNSLREHQKAVLLSCFIYDNPGYKVTERSTNYAEVSSAVRTVEEAGVELWQANFRIDPEGVELVRCFRLTYSEIAAADKQ